MDILNKINEKISKPTFEEFFFNKKNKKIIEKVWNRYYNEIAMQYGEDSMDDPQLYGSYKNDDDEFDMEVDPIEAYENFAHAMGYIAEYDASTETIIHFRNKFDYKRKDENDEDKTYKLAEYMGYKPSWR